MVEAKSNYNFSHIDPFCFLDEPTYNSQRFHESANDVDQRQNSQLKSIEINWESFTSDSRREFFVHGSLI